MVAQSLGCVWSARSPTLMIFSCLFPGEPRFLHCSGVETISITWIEAAPLFTSRNDWERNSGHWSGLKADRLAIMRFNEVFRRVFS